MESTCNQKMWAEVWDKNVRCHLNYLISTLKILSSGGWDKGWRKMDQGINVCRWPGGEKPESSTDNDW